MPPEVESIWKKIQSIPTVLAVFGDLKKDLNELAGMDHAEELYAAALSKHGVSAASEFRNLGKARQCASTLWESIQTLKAEPADIADDAPFGGEGRAA
jgi:hypothetical protein